MPVSDFLDAIGRKYGLVLTNEYGEPTGEGRCLLDGDAEIRHHEDGSAFVAIIDDN